MAWKLFLDDIRACDDDCVLARSVPEAISLIENKGFPSFISFDHDLGDELPTGKDFVNLIIDKCLDRDWVIPKDFSFEVHSDNPVGSANIRETLNSYLNHIGHSFFLERSTPYLSRK